MGVRSRNRSAASTRDAAAIKAAEIVSMKPPAVPDGVDVAPGKYSVQVLFEIGEDGSAKVELSRSCGSEELDREALASAATWRFTPALRDGIPARSYLRLEVEFEIE